MNKQQELYLQLSERIENFKRNGILLSQTLLAAVYGYLTDDITDLELKAILKVEKIANELSDRGL